MTDLTPPAGLSSKNDTHLVNARIYSLNGTVIDSQNKIRHKLSPDLRPTKSGHRLLDYRSLPAPRALSGHIFNLPSPASWKNYYHWLLETVPKLRHFTNQHSHILTPLLKSYHREALITAGVSEKKWIPLEETSHFTCPALSAYPPQTPTASNLSYLRGLFLPKNPPRPHRKIFISRRDTWRRQILNEDQFIPRLKKSGYEIHTLSNLTIAQQASLFASATHLISSHGAGLTNLIFCHPHTHILELFASNYHYRHYQELASIRQLSYQKHISPTENDNPHFNLELNTLPPL